MGTIKAIAGLLLIVGVVYSAFQIIPPEMNNYSFQDDLRNIAMIGAANHQSDADVVESVVRKAQALNLPVTAANVTIQHVGAPGMPAVYVAADYSVPVSLPGYSFTMHFTPSSGNKGF